MPVLLRSLTALRLFVRSVAAGLTSALAQRLGYKDTAQIAVIISRGTAPFSPFATGTAWSMDRAIVARARYVTEVRGVTLTEYISEAVCAIVDQDFGQAAKPTGEG
jgi:hypothetical protein